MPEGMGSRDFCQSDPPYGPVWGLTLSVCAEANTLTARRGGNYPHRHNPGLHLV